MARLIETLAKSAQGTITPDSVLLADDDPVSRRMLQSWLSKWNFEVTAVEDGLQAWQALQENEAPSLIILDWMMPGFSGVELCRKLRARNTGRYPYILLLTSKDGKQDLIEGLEAGADDYLTKPVDVGELKARLNVGSRIVKLHGDLIQKEEELRFEASHDHLTGLWNRGAILDFMEREISRARRSGDSVGALMIDIDHFKRVNDNHGHQAGDAVLQQVAKRLSAGLRTYDWLGRYGGEEFIAIVSNCNAETVATCAERLRAIVSSAPISATGVELPITVSIGAAHHWGEHAVTAGEMLRLADAALYRAKQTGRNQVVLAWDADSVALHANRPGSSVALRLP
jgi:two-component system cell cycle response regulator